MVKFIHKWLIFIRKRLFLLASIIFYSCFSAQEIKVDSIPEYLKLYNKACKLIDTLQYDEAMPILKKVLKENRDYYMAHNKIAYIFIKQNKNKEAVKNLNQAEKISPMNYETIKLKGLNFFFMGKYAESKSAIDSAAVVASEDKIDDPELFYYQAMLMYKGKSYKTAINTCITILDLNPRYLEALVLKANCRFALKDYHNAIIDFDEAIKVMPAEKPDYSCYRLRGKSKMEIKKYKEAINDWSVLLDAEPKDEEALISRAACKININDNTGAIVDLDEAININGKNPVSYCNRGIAKSGNRVFVEALKDIDYAIKLKFDYSAAYVNRAAVKMASKDKIGACEDLEKADSLGDNMAVRLIEQYCKGR